MVEMSDYYEKSFRISFSFLSNSLLIGFIQPSLFSYARNMSCQLQISKTINNIRFGTKLKNYKIFSAKNVTTVVITLHYLYNLHLFNSTKSTIVLVNNMIKANLIEPDFRGDKVPMPRIF